MLHAVTARKTIISFWGESDPAAAVIAVNVKPYKRRVIRKGGILPVRSEEFVVIVVNVVIQYCNSMYL